MRVYVVWAPSEGKLGRAHRVPEHALRDLCMGL